LEEAIMKTSEVSCKALEREEALKATMNEQNRKAVEEVVSSCLQSLSQPAANISPGLAQLKSSCASTEVSVRQDDDAGMRFPVDDVTAPLTSCELHIPEGNATVLVATVVISPIDPTKTQGSTRSQYRPDMLVSQWIEWSKAMKMWLWILKVVMGRRH
jgi:hypothetical protein